MRTKYYIVEYVHTDLPADRLIITTANPGKSSGYLGTSSGVARYARGGFASEAAAREYIETVLHAARGGVCEWSTDGCDVDVVASYRIDVDVDIYDGCF